MREKLIKSSFIIIVVMITSAVILHYCFVKGIKADPNNQLNQKAPQKRRKQPIIIWTYHIKRDTPESLKLALSSGLINHVSIGGTQNRRDADHKYNKKVKEAVNIAKRWGAKVIWSRTLWPIHKLGDVTFEDIFNPDYYIEEIRNIQNEANEINADYVMFGVEAYGKAPIKPYLKGQKKLTAGQIERLKLAIKKAIEKAGKVDFIIPAAVIVPEHPYSIIGELGRNKISTDTFWLNPQKFERINYEYQIFGAYLNTVKKDDAGYKNPYYLVSDIFENSHLWSDKEGVYLYPRENKALALAKELVKYANSLPYKGNLEHEKHNGSDQN